MNWNIIELMLKVLAWEVERHNKKAARLNTKQEKIKASAETSAQDLINRAAELKLQAAKLRTEADDLCFDLSCDEMVAEMNADRAKSALKALKHL